VIEAIRTHNHINGAMLSATEFGLIAVLGGLFTLLYALKANWIAAAICAGIAINALCVVAFAVAALRGGKRGASPRMILNTDYWRTVRETHPDLSRQTALITVSTIVPLALTVAVLADVVRGRGGGLWG
jgi:hypothetical protein